MAAVFLSGSSGQVWRLGQRITAKDVEAAAAEMGVGGTGQQRSIKRSSVTLADLLQHGLIHPGDGSISVTYKGAAYTASLSDDGTIVFEGYKFTSPTAFSIHVKRKQTPGKQGDDGWVSVHYMGQPLSNYRKEFAELLEHAGRSSGQQPLRSDQQHAAQQRAAPPAAAAVQAMGAAATRPRRAGAGSRGKQRKNSSRYSESDEDEVLDYGKAVGEDDEMEVDELAVAQFAGAPAASPYKIDGQLVVELPPGVEVSRRSGWQTVQVQIGKPV